MLQWRDRHPVDPFHKPKLPIDQHQAYESEQKFPERHEINFISPVKLFKYCFATSNDVIVTSFQGVSTLFYVLSYMLASLRKLFIYSLTPFFALAYR